MKLYCSQFLTAFLSALLSRSYVLSVVAEALCGLGQATPSVPGSQLVQVADDSPALLQSLTGTLLHFGIGLLPDVKEGCCVLSAGPAC